jgi:hypothetical protein
MLPSGVTTRTRLFSQSAMNKFPEPSMARPLG